MKEGILNGRDCSALQPATGRLVSKRRKACEDKRGLRTLRDERRASVLIRRRGCDAQAIEGWLGGVKRMGGK